MKQNISKGGEIPYLGGQSVGNRSMFQLMTIALLCSVTIFGCTQIRKLTYPENYVYLDKKQLTGKMALMSLYMRQIDEILLDNSTISSEQQGLIIRILTRIAVNTDSLATANYETSHLVIDDHVEQFKADVNLALNNARADPPNYFALGRLSGGCAACHRHR